MQNFTRTIAVIALLLGALPARAGSLTGVKTIQVNATEISDHKKVKESWAANWAHDQLVAAIQLTGFQVGEAPIHARIILDEFTSGSTATRVLVGFGAGRSSITARIVLEDSSGTTPPITVRIHVRGAYLNNSYEGGNTQTRQAENSFVQKLVEEIEKMK